MANHGDLPMLQAQAGKLRATIKRRIACAGASGQSDNVTGIVSHYSSVLAEIEEQIGQLKGASSMEAAAGQHVSFGAEEAAAGQRHVSFGAVEAQPRGQAGEPGGAPAPKRPAADSDSTVATVSTACSSGGEPQA